MRSVSFHGGLYGCALPDGGFAVLYRGSHIETDEGPVPLPDEDVLFLVACRFNNQVYLAGQGQDTDAAWAWYGTDWVRLGQTHGVSPCAFGPDALYVATSGSTYLKVDLFSGLATSHTLAIGSQGFRYADEFGPVTGDATYRLGDLFESTTRGNVQVGQGPESGCLVNGRELEPGDCRFIRFERDGDELAVYIVKLSENRAVAYWLTVDEIAALPLPSVPVVSEPIGPRSEPRAADGRLYDLEPFIVGDAALWPRTGTHPMHQVRDGDVLHFVKFGDASAYESWQIDDHWCYHLEDASNPFPYSFSDPRWLPRHMQIGEAHAFDTGPHEATFRMRGTCAVTAVQPFRRRMWLHAVYDAWYWGPDLGTRATVLVAYDSTAGIHGPERGVELYAFAHGAGWVSWEYHRSDRVYDSGPAVFDLYSRVSKSDFFRFGGPATLPRLTGCVSASVPSLPPLDDEPDDPDEDPMPIGPTPTQWIDDEWPRLEAQFIASGLDVPSTGMVAFMTLRRFGYFTGQDWSFESLMADLVAQGVANGKLPKEEP